MERSEFSRVKPGAELWVSDTGERVLFKWLTVEGARCSTGAGDRTFWLDELTAQRVAQRTTHKGRVSAAKRERVPVDRLDSAPTAAQVSALLMLDGPEVEIWYHDLGATTADALLARGWAHEVGRVRCLKQGHTHPGVLAITDSGRAVLSTAALEAA